MGETTFAEPCRQPAHGSGWRHVRASRIGGSSVEDDLIDPANLRGGVRAEVPGTRPRGSLATLDRHRTAPARLRPMGGAALALAYGSPRTTEEADLLLEHRELELLVESAGFGEALEAANRELEPFGLYVTHISGPEQQILTPGWREACVPIRRDPGSQRLGATALGPLGLIVSKLCRADDLDLADVRCLIAHEKLSGEAVRAAMATARVPPGFADVYPDNCRKVEDLLCGG